MRHRMLRRDSVRRKPVVCECGLRRLCAADPPIIAAARRNTAIKVVGKPGSSPGPSSFSMSSDLTSCMPLTEPSDPPSPTPPGPRTFISGCGFCDEGVKGTESRVRTPQRRSLWVPRPSLANVGSLNISAAAILPPTLLVYARTFSASTGVHTPLESLTPCADCKRRNRFSRQLREQNPSRHATACASALR